MATESNDNSFRFSIKSRFPVRLISSREVEIVVPLGNGPFPLADQFIQEHRLTEAECLKAAQAAIRSIAFYE